MFRIKHSFTIALLLFVVTLMPLHLNGQDHQKQKAATKKNASGPAEMKQEADYPLMHGTDKKIKLEGGSYFFYTFDKKPKLGTVIMKVVIFNSKNKKDTSLEVTADSGMPSMRGAHETGDKPFTLSNKGDYLLPIDIVMPGDWEVKLTITKAGKVIFRGSHKFDV